MGGEAKSDEKRRRSTKRLPAGLAGMLASGKSLAAIGAALDLDPDTIRRWLRDKPELVEQVERIQHERSEEVTRQLRGLDALGMQVLEGVLGGAMCEVCGRAPAEPRDRLKALHMLWSRTGRPEISGVQLSGSVATGKPTPPEMDRTILLGAADVLRDRGFYDLADAVKAAAEEEAGEGAKS